MFLEICGSGHRLLSNGTCEDCDYATYQNKNDALICFKCPFGFSTEGKKSDSLTDCKSNGNIRNKYKKLIFLYVLFLRAMW